VHRSPKSMIQMPRNGFLKASGGRNPRVSFGYLYPPVRKPVLPDLPINAAVPGLLTALDRQGQVLLEAPPGAGKSTIVPLVLLERDWLKGQKILMLEPRRLAARAVAQRMATLLGEPVGKTVGFRTRLETRVSKDSRVEVVTEGILTRMLQSDAALSGIGCVIFDEFHERSLNADLGLALSLQSQETLREDLRILVMSATLDARAIAKVLPSASVINAQGRSFEVATHYVARRQDVPLELQVSHVVRAALRDHAGDILCFLPGAAEIRRVQRNLETAGLDKEIQVMPLFGDLDMKSQDAALSPAATGKRKVVLATSIAETSLTIEGIRVVVDGGLRRYSEFDPASGMSRLMTGSVSQAAADQRRGRAGRVAAGDCYRLWSEGTQASLAAQTPPEILHADLAPLALELACWGIVDADSLAWIDSPPAAPLAQARELLQQLGALDTNRRATAHGRELASLGMHPRLAHMLVNSKSIAAVRLASDLAATLSERDVLRSAPGVRDADIRLRAAVMRGERRELPSGLSVDERALSQAKASSSAWLRQFGGARDAAANDDAAGVLLAWAFPDRVARARGGDGRYLLANGRGARFAEPQALTKSEFIVAAELDGAERDARIFLAAPISLAEINAHCAALISEHSEVRWDERQNAVLARRERRLGAVVLESADLRDADADEVLRASLQGLKALGLGVLPWTPALRQWQARVLMMKNAAVPAPTAWPDLSDQALLDDLEAWAAPWLLGLTRKEHFSKFNLVDALHGLLTHAQSSILAKESPTHFTVPSGSSIAIDYTGDTPSLSVRLQELFGLNQTPSIAAGKIPLLLKMLSPAGRPVQITRDLVSFWDRGYHEVKKDLKGRYPKHYWPDDPHTAVATRRARPR
jgi:ATP-dependent helicase HrpB